MLIFKPAKVFFGTGIATCHHCTIILLSKQLTWQVKNKYVKFIKGAISELPLQRWMWARKGDKGAILPFVLGQGQLRQVCQDVEDGCSATYGRQNLNLMQNSSGKSFINSNLYKIQIFPLIDGAASIFNILTDWSYLPLPLWGGLFTFSANMWAFSKIFAFVYFRAGVAIWHCTIVPSKQLTWQMKNNYVNLIKGAPVLDASRKKGAWVHFLAILFRPFTFPFNRVAKPVPNLIQHVICIFASVNAPL